MANEAFIGSAAMTIRNIRTTPPSPFATPHLIHARLPPQDVTAKDRNVDEGVSYLAFRSLMVYTDLNGLHVAPAKLRVSDCTLLTFPIPLDTNVSMCV